jgi:hypothetical protein
MSENLCTTAMVLDATGLRLAAFMVATPPQLRVGPPRAPVKPRQWPRDWRV